MLVLDIPSVLPKYLNYIFFELDSKAYFFNYYHIDKNIFITDEQRCIIRQFMEKNIRIRNICRKFVMNIKM